MKHIDFHTHRLKEGISIQILNIFAQDLSADEPKNLFSSGLHPWHIGKVNTDECFRSIELAMRQKNMLAIGECGLDRSISTDIRLQEEIFRRHIEIAIKYAKPLIIHCVRAYSDLLKLKKETKPDLPWIIHGYQGNIETTKSLIKQGFYFSVGEHFLKNRTKQEALLVIPIDRLFLETDENNLPIDDIYTLAAELLKIDNEMLAAQIQNNFTQLFGNLH